MPNQHFGPHYDDVVVDPSGNGSRSEWTLLIYLTGIEDGVKGGEMVFYPDNKMKKQVKPLVSSLHSTLKTEFHLLSLRQCPQ